MPELRHPSVRDPAGIRTFAVTFSPAASRIFVPPVTPGWHQLIHLSTGAATVRAAEHDWLVIAPRALWIPARTPFSIHLRGEVALRALYFPRLTAGLPRTCSAINITPLLRELILRANSHGALLRHHAPHRRLIAVIRDELRVAPDAPLQLPLPRDPRALRFLELLEESAPSARPPLAHLFRGCGASQRTLERIFPAETKLSLGQWMRRHGLLKATARLASGEPVRAVSDWLGYNNPSAFIAMFKRELGQSPGAYSRG
jgi:AraC-like DNA-binding protein